jgi:CheY-like chemotaxis protein
MTRSQPDTANPQAVGVLVVDDDAAIRLAVQELLAEEGYAVRAAQNGSDALDLLRLDHPLPALILLDLRMPVMDGWAFRRQQAADTRLASIPVVVLTADGTVAARVAEMNVAGALAKPLRLEALLSAVARHCSVK